MTEPPHPTTFLLTDDTDLDSFDAADLLGIDPGEVYPLLFTGELAGGPTRSGWVRFPQWGIDDYLARHPLPTS